MARGTGVCGALPKGTAGGGSGRDFVRLAQAQAQCGVTEISRLKDEEMMGLVPDIAHGGQGIGPDLPLQRQHILLGVGNRVGRLITRDRADRLELGEVDVGVRITSRYI